MKLYKPAWLPLITLTASVSSVSAEPTLFGKYEAAIQPSELNCEFSPIIVTTEWVVAFETGCKFPQPLTGNETEYTGVLLCEGEGETFTEHKTLNLFNDNLIITHDNGESYIYHRCPE